MFHALKYVSEYRLVFGELFENIFRLRAMSQSLVKHHSQMSREGFAEKLKQQAKNVYAQNCTT
jgi:hypothetical protein